MRMEKILVLATKLLLVLVRLLALIPMRLWEALCLREMWLLGWLRRRLPARLLRRFKDSRLLALIPLLLVSLLPGHAAWCWVCEVMTSALSLVSGVWHLCLPRILRVSWVRVTVLDLVAMRMLSWWLVGHFCLVIWAIISLSNCF
jgi:hypothetical protein